MNLNGRSVPGPRGGQWAPTTINGNRDRGTGVLNNELYAGRLVWNKLSYSKDPETGKRRSRVNASGKVITTGVPELRIVDDALWQAVRDRQDRLSHREPALLAIDDATSAFWSKQRPRHLFSGLMRCGLCGGGFSKISAAHFGCSTARNKGPTTCTNLLTVRQDRLEETVLEGLRGRLMDPVLYEEFALAFTTEWNKLQAAATGDQTAREAELARVKAQLGKLVDALCNGTAIGTIQQRMETPDSRRQALEAELATAQAPTPRLHPHLAVLYREKVAALTEAFEGPDGAGRRGAGSPPSRTSR